MGSLQGKAAFPGGDGVGAIFVLGEFGTAVQQVLEERLLPVEVPALAVGIGIPAVDLVAAVVQGVAGAGIGHREGQLAALFHKDIITGHGSVVVVDDGLGAQLGLCAIAHHQAAAALGKVFLGRAVFLCGVVARNGHIGTVINAQLAAAVAENAAHLIILDGDGAVHDVHGGVALEQTHTGVPVGFALGAGDGNSGILDGSLSGEDDAVIAVVVGGDGGILNVQVSGRQAMAAIVAEIDRGVVLDIKVGAVGAVAGAFDHV